MKARHWSEIEAKDADEGASKLKVRWLITKDMGARNFAMRLFEMQPGGNSPLHSHDWEHEVFVLEGEGTVLGGSEERQFKPGDAVFVPPNERHQFRNTGKKPVKFLCLVPYHEG
jgi:quercetin dioxygenase-like cupin family protein